MTTNPGVSEVQDKNGVIADIEAKRFDGTRTVQIKGDVTATQTWNGDSNTALTLNASIGAKKVTQDKIGDKAVGSGQMADGSVGLTQMDLNAMNGTVQDNDSKLATHSAVKTYVDSQISGQGTYLGKHTVAEINAFVTDNLHNGDRVMVSDSGTINLGPGGVGFDVIAGEDLILYKSGSTVQWDTMDGNFKTKQNAVSKAGSTTKTVTAFSQNENGDADVTYEEIQRASTSHEGLVQLTDSHASTSTTTAATPNSVKSAYDLANTANTGLANKLDKTGDGKDVTVSFTEASARANIGTGEKLSVMFGKIKKWFTDLKALAFKDTVSDSDISGTISDNHIASASTWNGKYALPNGGIPKTDLASAVQTSLDKADTALQSHQPVDQNFSTPSSTNPVSTAAVVGYALPKISVEFNREIAFTTGKKLCIGKFPMGDSNLSIVLTDTDAVGRYASIVIATQNVDLERGGLYTVSMYGDSSNDVYSRLSVKYSSGSRNFEVYYNWTGNYNRVQCHIRGTRLAGNPTDVMTLVDSIPSDYLLPIENKSVYATRIGTYESHPSIGTPSIPVYVDTNGLVLACTGPFVNNIEYVANQSGGGGNLNKTINGTTTSVLSFMNDSEAVAIWADAKTAAANAS